VVTTAVCHASDTRDAVVESRLRPSAVQARCMEILAALLVIVTMAYLEVHEDD
jgi:hypothetical protein